MRTISMNLRATHPRTTTSLRASSQPRLGRLAAACRDALLGCVLRAAVPCGSGCARLRDLSDCV
jgi:hypothetical protein